MYAISCSVVLLLLVLLLLWLLDPVRSFKRWRLHRKIPMPKSLQCHWLLGHVPELQKRTESFWKQLDELMGDHPGILRLLIGHRTCLFVSHPKYVAAVMKEPKTPDYSVLEPWLGEGLLIAEGKKWLRNRRLLTPAFHYSILKNYTSIYNTCVAVLVQKWKGSAERNMPVHVFHDISSMSLDIILQCSFSCKANCQGGGKRHPYAEACCQLVEQCSERFVSLLYRIDWIYWNTSHGKRMKELCKIVHDHAEQVIRERREVLASQEQENVAYEKRKHLDFLDILLMARDEEDQGMSDLEIRNEVDTFMFEGHDTTTSGMSWTLYCLAQHPQHQDKVREEVRNVLKGREWLEYEDLKQLNYTSWCIKEAMRLYPPVNMIGRRTEKEIHLGEYLIPEKTDIDILVYQIHRNPAIWDNPSVFNPLRFQPQNMEKHGPYDYIPFSAGSRNCIGQNFAMNEMKVVITTIVTHFQMSLVHSVDVDPLIILKSKPEIKLILEPLS